MPRNVQSAAHPHMIMLRYMVQKALQPHDAAWPAQIVTKRGNQFGLFWTGGVGGLFM